MGHIFTIYFSGGPDDGLILLGDLDELCVGPFDMTKPLVGQAFMGPPFTDLTSWQAVGKPRVHELRMRFGGPPMAMIRHEVVHVDGNLIVLDCDPARKWDFAAGALPPSKPLPSDLGLD